MEPRREDYKGHVIEVRQAPADIGASGDATPEALEPGGDGGPELLIDGESVRYGQLPDGSFALHDYAYDWTGDLVDLARRYIDYQNRTG